MRKLYSFTLFKENIKEEPQIQKNEKGEDIKVLVNVTEKVPLNYFISKPDVILTQEAELYYESIVAKCISKGIYSQSQLNKRFINDGGVLSELEIKEWNGLWEQAWEKQAEKTKLNENQDDNKDKIQVNEKELVDILSKIQSFQNKHLNTLTQHTAENIARNRTAIWWTLHLSYKDTNGKSESIFGNGDFDSRLKIYSELEQKEDAFDIELLKKLLLVTSLWVFGKASKQEDFDILLKMSENSELLNMVDKNNS